MGFGKKDETSGAALPPSDAARSGGDPVSRQKAFESPPLGDRPLDRDAQRNASDAQSHDASDRKGPDGKPLDKQQQVIQGIHEKYAAEAKAKAEAGPKPSNSPDYDGPTTTNTDGVMYHPSPEQKEIEEANAAAAAESKPTDEDAKTPDADELAKKYAADHKTP